LQTRGNQENLGKKVGNNMGMVRKLSALLSLLALVVASAANGQGPAATLEIHLDQKAGWMPGGWGSYHVKIANTTASSFTIVKWKATWQAKNKPIGEPWSSDVKETVAAGKSFEKVEINSLPQRIYDQCKPEAPQIAGTYTVAQEGKQFDVPFTLTVPGAQLPEPLKEIDGKTVGLALMQSRYKGFKKLDRTLHWIDLCYQQMIDLTGEHPFGGARMIFKESPAHPWWAYAGKEMILNTDYVGATLKDFDDGILVFGWVHEVGHNFDVLGDWYMWDSASTEWQGNFKLAYALETLPDQTFRMRCNYEPPGYPAANRDLPITGPQLVERFFAMFGDVYLADPKREWTTLTSDEMHTFFQRLQRVYGWEPFKAWYRTYRKLADAGQKPPTVAADKVNLTAAILSHECHVDLVPVFARWRFPVTQESMRVMAERYGIPKP
jgi:hypothetical protein